jgi:large subunit ribosomal protein L17
MRHRVAGKHLGRSVGQRNALRRILITQFLLNEKIVTTEAKVDAIRAEAERTITKAKRSLAKGDAANIVHVRRLLAARLDGKEVVQKVFDELAPRYAERPGGYTRVYKLGPRKGDSAEMVLMELVDRPAQGTASNASEGQAGASGGLLGRFGRRRRGQSDAGANE